ncbi:DMT family transporter [Alcanivorax marinus]|uniref:DMT family transporter n=1 Tax=Alloalcanivorax marinus TaxID=1177169 RepID=A0A9Q3YQ89_9GAMM|nr:DMT family transporter [Alloalcanivorax marinus]MCC4309540.1 DMT family transporter [Alloalcanivorax marinus]
MTQRAFWQSGLMLVALATFAMAFKGIFARLVYQYGVSVDVLLIWRFVLAVPLFWVGALWLNRHRPKARLSARQWLLCGVSGLLFFFSTWCDFNAIHELGASLSRMLLYLFPALVMLLDAARARRLPSPLHALVFAGAWTGIALLLLPGWQAGRVTTHGVLYGLGAAACYASFLTLSQGLMKPLGSVRFNQVSNSFTLVFMGVGLLPGIPASELLLSAPALGWMVVLVVLSTVLPFFLLFEGFHRANASEAAVVAMFGPVVTVTAALVLFPDEHLGPVQWLGMAVVMLSIGSLPWLKRRDRG